MLLVCKLRKHCHAEILSGGPTEPPEKKKKVRTTAGARPRWGKGNHYLLLLLGFHIGISRSKFCFDFYFSQGRRLIQEWRRRLWVHWNLISWLGRKNSDFLFDFCLRFSRFDMESGDFSCPWKFWHGSKTRRTYLSLVALFVVISR